MSAIDHPSHYTSHPSGIECIEITGRLPFCLGNAVKYLWRCDAKGAPVEDLRKALWYLRRESERETHPLEMRALDVAWASRTHLLGIAAGHSPEPLRVLLEGLVGHFHGSPFHHMTRVLRRAEDSVEREIARREAAK